MKCSRAQHTTRSPRSTVEAVKDKAPESFSFSDFISLLPFRSIPRTTSAPPPFPNLHRSHAPAPHCLFVSFAMLSFILHSCFALYRWYFRFSYVLLLFFLLLFTTTATVLDPRVYHSPLFSTDSMRC